MTSHKTNVTNFAQLLHPTSKIEIIGTRVRAKKSKGYFSKGYFLAEVFVDGNMLAFARHSNWRIAYKDLTIQLSKQCFI